MALINNPAGAPASQAQTSAAKDDAAFKIAKKAAADKHREKVKADREKAHKFFLGLRDHLQQNGNFEKLTSDEKDYILANCAPSSERVNRSGPSFFVTIFGPTPKVGDKVTLKDVIAKTYKGMDTMAAYVKKWSQKGIEVDITVNKQDMLTTTYTIKKIA